MATDRRSPWATTPPSQRDPDTTDAENQEDLDLQAPHIVITSQTVLELWTAANPDHLFFRRGGTLDTRHGYGQCVLVGFGDQQRNLAYPFDLVALQQTLTKVRYAVKLGVAHQVFG